MLIVLWKKTQPIFLMKKLLYHWINRGISKICSSNLLDSSEMELFNIKSWIISVISVKNFKEWTIKWFKNIQRLGLISKQWSLFRMVKNKKIRKNWSNKDLKILVWIIAKFCEKNKIKDIYSGIVMFLFIQKKHHW